jgi:molybdopterin-guanine dinucleotide biosynthesis protein A
MNYPLPLRAPNSLAAFLLAGGASRRMGSDKALLPFGDKTLIEHLAGMLLTITPAVTIVAPAGRYEAFGLPVVADLRPHCGPLGGIEAALSHSQADWNLILACDLPRMTGDWLQTLTKAARADARLRIVASGEPPNPLAAVWHRSALTPVQEALDRGELRVRDLLGRVSSKTLIPQDPEILANWNRPEDTQKLGC